MTDARDREHGFGPFEGMFSSDAARAKLAERYGPERCWSPSQLEQYAYCPQQFFLHNVLRVKPLTRPELGIDYLERGQMLHWLLSTAHRELNDRAGGPGFSRRPGLAAVQRRRAAAGRGIAAATRAAARWKAAWWKSTSARSWPGSSVTVVSTPSTTSSGTAGTLPPRPAHFEVAVRSRGMEDEVDDVRAASRRWRPAVDLEPFELDCGDETVRFAGRIDRIDLGRLGGQAVFTIVDYKSGAVSKRTNLQAVLERATRLQLPLYALAAERLLAEHGAAPFRAAYWHLAGKGYQEKEAVKFRCRGRRAARTQRRAGPSWRSAQAARAVRWCEGIRQRRVSRCISADDKCTGLCDYSTVCRVNQARSLGQELAAAGSRRRP